MKEMGIGEEEIVSAAMQLYFPHPGVETREKAEAVFRREIDLAFSDPNLALLVYARVLLEEEGKSGNLPGLSSSDYESDLTFLIADEVLGLAIAKYVVATKGSSIMCATTRPSRAYSPGWAHSWTMWWPA